MAIVEQIKRNHGGVDILINNAVCALNGAIEETTIDDARYLFEVCLFGLARITQLVLPYMREKKAGKIVNISSLSGKIYAPLGAWYTAAKHALEGWSDNLRFEVERFNAGRPRTRYAVGPGARLLILVRKWFGDRSYDGGMARTYRL